MKSSNSTKRKSKGSNDGGAKQFLVWHGEKIAVAVVVLIALWFAMNGLGYPTLSWQPDELTRVSTEAEDAIKRSTRTAEDEEIKVFDYAAYAEGIKKGVEVEPYRTTEKWNPLPTTGQRSTSGSSATYSTDY